MKQLSETLNDVFILEAFQSTILRELVADLKASGKWEKTGGTATASIASNGVWKAETTGTLKAKASIGTIESDEVTISVY